MLLSIFANLSATSILLIAAAFVIIAHCLLWLAYVYVRYDSREWFARIFDPGSYPSGSLWEAFVQALHGRITGRIRRESPGPDLFSSRTRTYRSVEQIAHGDLCDVHYATSQRDAFVLKLPRVSGCDRLLAKEQMILRKLQRQSRGDSYGDYFPTPVESFWSGRQFVSAMNWREGYFTAKEIRQRHPGGVDGRHLAWMLNRTLEALGFVHSLGWVHGAVLPPHMLFDTEDHGLRLIGWIHASPIGTPLSVIPRKFKSWYPLGCHRHQAATPATDIHLAAQSILWLAGGDPAGDRLPKHLPMEFGCFLRECLTQPESHCPDADSQPDAWALHEQFRELLEDLYGPPKFCHLNMS